MICKTILKAVTTQSYIVLLLLILNTQVFEKFKAMKLFATTILLFVTFICLSNNSKTEKNIFDNVIIEYTDSIVCSKTFSIELKGNVTNETAKQVIDYILNKKGICNVTIDVVTKKITLDVVEDMDFESIKGLVNYTHHLFLLEDTDHPTESK